MIPSITHALQSALLQEADKEALVLLSPAGEQRATCAEIDAHARHTAHLLTQNGIQPGDILLILLDHTYEAVPMFLGAMYMGAIPMIMPYLTAQTTAANQAEQIANLVAFFKPSGILTVPRFEQEIGALDLPLKTLAWDFNAVDAATVAPFTLSTRSGEDIAYLQFTSGTTGRPKAVMTPHNKPFRALHAAVEWVQLTDADTAVFALPLYSASGLSGAVLWMLLCRARSVIIDPSHWAQQPAILLRAYHDYRANFTLLTNTGLKLTLARVQPEELAGIDLSSLRTIMLGSEMISPATVKAFAKRLEPLGLNGNAIKTAYGASETYIAFQSQAKPWHADTVSALALVNENRAIPVAANDPNARLIACCGATLGDDIAEIRDEAGNILPDRHLGEIVVRTQALFTGYWNNPELTATVLKNGWYHTGDMGYMVDGELYVVGRVKDLIIVGGRNLLPEAVEEDAMVAGHGLLRGAVAFGVRNEDLGTEQPVVICELIAPLDEDARNQAAKAIRTRARQRLDVALADVYFVDAGWVVRAGVKLARNANRDKYLAERKATPSTSTAATDAPIPEQIVAIFEEILGHKPIGLHDNFFDLGGDSISALKMMLQVEKQLGHTVPAEFFQNPTADTLVRLITGEAISPADTSSKETAPASAPASGTAREDDKRPWTVARVRNGLRRRIETRAFHKDYFSGVRWLAAWSGNRTIQQLFYPQEVALFRQFWVSLHGTKPLDPQELQRNLMGNIILQRLFKYINRQEDAQDDAQQKHAPEGQERGRFIPALQASPLRWMRELGMVITEHGGTQGQRIFELHGRDTLDKALQSGQGVIVISYHATTRFLGIDTFLNLDVEQYWLGMPTYRQILRTHYGPETPQLRAKQWPALRAQATQQARAVLENGGMVGMSADELDFKSTVLAHFGDRTRPMQTGFAELAVATGAAVIPIYTELHLDGRITQHILPALDSGEATMSHDERVAHLTQQAAAFLLQTWSHAPNTYDWVNMKLHLQLPPTQGAREP